jgi:prepilin-type N-terminal cleavage/methylation domain-containing protein
MNQTAKRRRGFTLVELIIVMIVIFTLATIVAPRFSDFFPSLQIRKSTESLLAWSRKARADAAVTGTRQRLLLDTANRRYWIEYEARPIKEPGKFTALSGAWNPETLPEAVTFESIQGAETDASNGALRYVEFRPDGTSSETTVILSNDNGDRQTLRVEGATSKIYIEPAAGQP